MKILLATLCLNEMEWLPKLYLQHRGWPNRIGHVFVEGADPQYAEHNPGMTTTGGLSVDGTSDFLFDLSKFDDRVHYIPYGLSQSDDPAQGKCPLRNVYLEIADKMEPDFLIIIDGDEFYPEKWQKRIADILLRANKKETGFCFRQRHIWRPPFLSGKDLFEMEVRGGFWAIPHCRVWRFFKGMRHITNHNTPEHEGSKIDRRMRRYDKVLDSPECIHLGFASNITSRKAKHKYYRGRGEGKEDHRGWYVQSRRAFEVWTPDNKLPNNAEIVPYTGLIPEIFHPNAMIWIQKEEGYE